MFIIDNIKTSLEGNKPKPPASPNPSKNHLSVNGEPKLNFQTPRSEMQGLQSDRTTISQNPRRRSIDSYRSDDVNYGPKLQKELPLPQLKQQVGLDDEPEAPNKDEVPSAGNKKNLRGKVASMDIRAGQDLKNLKDESQITMKTKNVGRSLSELEINLESQEDHNRPVESLDSRNQLNNVTSLGKLKSLSYVPDDDTHIRTDFRSIEVVAKTMESIADKNEKKKKAKAIGDKSKTYVKAGKKSGNKGLGDLAAKQFKSASFDQKLQISDAVQLKLKGLVHNELRRSPQMRRRKMSQYIKFSLKLGTILAFLYIGLPIGLLFAACDYDREDLLASVNFGFLGAFQGLVEIAFLYYLIDLPIRDKIKEIEGLKKGWINMDDYLVINKLNCVLIFLFSAGIQIGAGNFMKDLGIEIGPKQILACCLLITAFKGLLWLVMIMFRTPTSIFAGKVIVKKEIEHIGKIRKDFMEHLKQTKNKIEMIGVPIDGETDSKVNPVNLEELMPPEEKAQKGALDFRKFSVGTFDHGREFKLLRLQSIKVYIILVINYGQIFAQFYLIKSISETTPVPVTLLIAAVVPVISFIFSLFDFFTHPTSLHLTAMKVFSIVIQSTIYRFLYLQVEDQGVMIGILAMKLLYKGIVYFGGMMFGGDLLYRLRARTKSNKFTVTAIENNITNEKFRKYLFLKFVVLQSIEFFCEIGLLVPLALTKADFSNYSLDFGYRTGDVHFYIYMALVEAVIEIGISVLLFFLTRKLLSGNGKNKLSSKSLIDEARAYLSKKKYIVITAQILTLFLIFFVFFNA